MIEIDILDIFPSPIKSCKEHFHANNNVILVIVIFSRIYCIVMTYVPPWALPQFPKFFLKGVIGSFPQENIIMILIAVIFGKLNHCFTRMTKQCPVSLVSCFCCLLDLDAMNEMNSAMSLRMSRTQQEWSHWNKFLANWFKVKHFPNSDYFWDEYHGSFTIQFVLMDFYCCHIFIAENLKCKLLLYLVQLEIDKKKPSLA